MGLSFRFNDTDAKGRRVAVMTRGVLVSIFCNGVAGSWMMGALHMGLDGAVEGAELGEVVQELARLADQVNQVKQQLESAAGSTKWAGAAASAFQQRARQRQQQVADLARALDSAHAAVGSASAMAGIS